MKPFQLQALALAQNEVWAIMPGVLQAALLNSLTESIVEAPSLPEREALSKPGPKAGRVAVVPVFGAITHRDSFWSMFMGGGGATVERLTKTLREYGADPAVGTVLLNVDSPGGTVDGVPELAAEVRALRATKHVVALANSLAASAAYWVASQADEIVATPEALIGSIGVFTIHEDYSAMLDQAGIKATLISAGKYKTEANPYEPLTPEAQDHLQSLVDAAYGLFVTDVARGRGVTPATVRSDYGQGRVFTAAEAKGSGLIDRVATADETIKRLAGRQAELDGFPLTARGNDMGSNSQAQLALKRRRLELLNQIYEEDES
jgi:signal peptide peptidase SppA